MRIKGVTYNDGEPTSVFMEDVDGTKEFARVVHCRDCKYYKESKVIPSVKFCYRLIGKDGNPVGYNFSEDDFCSRGKRKPEMEGKHVCSYYLDDNEIRFVDCLPYNKKGKKRNE